MAGIDGAQFTLGFAWDGSGTPRLTQAGVSPIFSPRPVTLAPTQTQVIAQDVFILGGSAAGAIAIGMARRAARDNGPLITPKDFALDGIMGLAGGSCLVSTPLAESACTAFLTTMPLQILNYNIDPGWDARYGVATTVAFSLVRSELGGNWIPYSGYRLGGNGEAVYRPAELVANATADVGQDAAFFALSNGAAAFLQGKPVGKFSLIGAGYGGAYSTLVNVALGAPIKLTPPMLKSSAPPKVVAEGPDVSEVARYTTFRSGGIWELASPTSSITLGRNVALAKGHIFGGGVPNHELHHRFQISGSPDSEGRAGNGLLGFYADYGVTAPLGYRNIPSEEDAFHFGQNMSAAAAPRTNYGKLVAAPFALSLAWAPLTLMPPK
ncbi:MAG: hypothetical protein IT381_15785 [Deltaproteobacteria bacterium]|nr:hypothetical protein [Deltaproteobacteria bacterium]